MASAVVTYLEKRRRVREPCTCKTWGKRARAKDCHVFRARHTSCITTRTFAANTEPRDTCVEASILLSVANTSVHFAPSLDTDTAKDFAGNSQERARDSNLCWPPRSTVSVTGSVGSNALAWHMGCQTKCGPSLLNLRAPKMYWNFHPQPCSHHVHQYLQSCWLR